MRIQPVNLNTYTPKYKQPLRETVKPYAYDTVKFTASRIPELTSTDLYCIKALNPPPEKTGDKRDLDRWAQEQYYDKSNINLYYSKFPQDNVDRIYRLDVWKENLKNNLYENNPSLALLVLDSITSPLSPNNHAQPPIYNTKVFYKTIDYMMKNPMPNKQSFQPTFRKIYENTLRHYVLTGDTTVGKLDTTWVKIPSKRNDEENFRTNLNKLKILSNQGWCTKATHAQTYLEDYDYYIYIQKGQPKLFIKTQDGEIKKIQCGADSSKISYKYVNEIKECIEKEDLKTDRNEKRMIADGINTEKRVKALKNKLADDIKSNNQEVIFNELGIATKRNENGALIISHYTQPDEGFTYKDLGIDENMLMKNVEEIEGYADFIRSNATYLDDLKKIGKDANFMYSKIKSLNNLEYIGGLANFMFTINLTSLPKLSYVGEKIAVDNSNITEIPLLEKST